MTATATKTAPRKTSTKTTKGNKAATTTKVSKATTATIARKSAKDDLTREALVNPFKVGEVITIPSGSTFTSTAPTIKGRQKVKRAHKVTISGSLPAQIAPRNSEKGSKVLVRPLRIRAKGSGGYWKDINLNEKIIKLNGKTPTYEILSLAQNQEVEEVEAVEAE